MADLDVRPVTEEEWPAFIRNADAAFGSVATDEAADPVRRSFPLERSVGAFEGGDIVGNGGAYPFDITLPGPATVPAAGVTYIGVRQTHKRRGVLTAMMRHLLDDAHRRGEPMAVLLASESIIYGRFGYGLATIQPDYVIDRRHTGLLPGLDRETAGRLRMLDADTARKVFPEVHDRCRRTRPGDVSRTDLQWDAWFRRGWPQEGPHSFDVVHEDDDGTADGFATYRMKVENDEPRVVVFNLYAENADAYLALWRHVTDIDLSVRTVLAARPLDEPFRHMLADPRRLETKRTSDFLWARPVDVERCLAARTYSAPGRVVLEVVDDFCPWNAGRYVVESTADGDTDCRRTSDATADLTLSAAELGAAILGGVSLVTLGAAGRVDEHTPAALDRAARMFSIDPSPWCGTFF